MTIPKIAIIGAGPAGLVLARILQKNGISCTIFEKEKSRHARTQGGTLDLHEDSAQLSLREAGLYDEFLALSRPDGEVLKVFTPEGKVLLDENEGYGVGRPDEMKNRPEIDRDLLRGILLDSLDPESVQWGRPLHHIETVAHDRYNLHFQGSVEKGFDLVVGADGTWSKVRARLSDTVPFYSGVTGVDVTISDADVRRPEQARRVGGGMCLTIGKDKDILSQRNGNGSIRVYAFMRVPEFWHKDCGIDWNDPVPAKKKVIETYYADWDQGAKDMVLKADDETIVRPMYMLPIGFKWDHTPGVTLVGDAAHVMCPFAGVGVNVGMQDALELARRLISRRADLQSAEASVRKASIVAALKDYELEMFSRAEANAKKTWEYLNVFFNPVGAEFMVQYFGGIKEKEERAKADAEAASAGGAID